MTEMTSSVSIIRVASTDSVDGSDRPTRLLWTKEACNKAQVGRTEALHRAHLLRPRASRIHFLRLYKPQTYRGPQ